MNNEIQTKKSNHDNRKRKFGFTIIETLVAVSVLVIAVTGPLSLASKGLAYSQYAKDEITAFYLANEAMDLIRNIRDTNIKLKPIDQWINVPGPIGPDITMIEKCPGKTNNDKGCSFDVWKNPPNLKNTFLDIADTKIKICTKNGGIFYGHSFEGLFNNAGCQQSGDIIEETQFYRRIFIQEMQPDKEIRVTVIVNWEAANGLPRKVVFSENLFKFIQ